MISVKPIKGSLEAVSAGVKARAHARALDAFRKIVVRETLPARRHVKAAALGTLPHHGGLNRRVARMPRAIVLKRGNQVTVIIRDSAPHMNLYRIDKGEVHHPTFGNRSRWYTQRVAPGFFTLTLDRERPLIQAEVTTAINNYMDSINRDLGKGSRL